MVTTSDKEEGIDHEVDSHGWVMVKVEEETYMGNSPRCIVDVEDCECYI